MTPTTRARLGALTVAMLTACGADGSGTTAAASASTPAQVDAKRPPATATPAQPPEPPPIGDAPLASGKTSLAALGQAVVEALAANEPQALWALAVSEAEYTRLFGALVSHPNMLRFGPKLAWASQLEDNRDAVAKTLAEHGGKGYTFVSLEPTRTEERGGLVIYRAPKLTVRDAGGATLEPQVIGVALEHAATHTFLVLTFAH